MVIAIYKPKELHSPDNTSADSLSMAPVLLPGGQQQKLKKRKAMLMNLVGLQPRTGISI
jgi:hypothetical protein